MVYLTNLNEEPQSRNTRSLADNYNIPISSLDFEYVKKCSNGNELEKILLILRSGEEGHYPALIEETENRLEIIKPNSKYIKKATPVISKHYLDKNEQFCLEDDLRKWMETANKSEKTLRAYTLATNNNVPQIRAKNNFTSPKTKTAVQRIKSTDYSSWDKYDPDTEILKMDLEIQKFQKKLDKEVQVLKSTEEQIKSHKLLTEAEEIFEADREREKGNEYFRAGDYKEALMYYTNSIYFFPSAANYNNRALVQIKLKNYERAVEDCEFALKYEPQNIKALSRLAQGYDALKDYEKALKVCETAIKINPNSDYLQNLLNKLNEYFGKNKNKTRLIVKETFKSKNTKNKNQTILLPIPGPSNMPEPYFIKLKSKDIHLVKMHEKMISNRQQFIHRGVIDDNDDYECTEIHIQKSDSKLKLFYNNGHLGCVKTAKEFKIEGSSKQKIIADNNYVKIFTNQLLNIDFENGHDKDEYRKRLVLNQRGGGGEPHVENNNTFRVNPHDINTPYSFLKMWKTVERDSTFTKHAEVLRNLNVDNLNTVLGNKLDGSMLGSILFTLYQHFSVPNETGFVHNILEAMTRVSRFSLAVMFLSNDDKRRAESLFQFLNHHGKPLGENIRNLYL